MRANVALCERLGVRYPIVQAPLGGIPSVELVAAVSNAGALGMLGAAYLTPDAMREAITAIRARTDQPFGVNLFAGGAEQRAPRDPERMLAIVGRYHAELGLPAPSMPTMPDDPFAAQLEVVLELGVPIFSFVFGIPSPAALARLKGRGVTVVGTATTVAEALLLEAAGVDAIVAQGSEAGGHRATFSGDFEAGMVGTLALVPQVVDAVRVPVIASGGIMDGRGIVAAQALGAAAVQLGTAFLACRESGATDAYKTAIRGASDDGTALTRAFSGRPARGIVNRFMQELREHEDVVLPFPLQNALTRPLRNAATKQGDTRFLSLWAGQGAPMATDLPAAELVQQLVDEAMRIRAELREEQPS